jgi:hypothetical protein
MTLHLRTGAFCLLAVLALGCRGRHEGPGEIVGGAVPPDVLQARVDRQEHAAKRLRSKLSPEARALPAPKQILFGDLHVHTTFSIDAFMRTLPLMGGEGAHPPADACDFARYCSDLDFWSINDHAEGVTLRHWQETKESIRQCNALAGDPRDPDVVAFLGWEWSQMGTTPENHYGHKNVIFRDTEEDRVPKRPISARSNSGLVGALRRPQPIWQRLRLPLLDFPNRQRYLDYGFLMRQLREGPLCPDGVDTRELPPDCHEVALTPGLLFEKLSQWGFDAIVIPHGTSWGWYTPPGTTLDKQLTTEQHDPEWQSLFEIYSGHGNAEEYREWRAVMYDSAGEPVCPEPTPDYLPCCWQAGELIRARCDDPGSEECERRAADARRIYLEAGAAGHATVLGAEVADWKDCGYCRDCFNPAFKHRVGNFGFIGSSDNHTARPGTGYKEYRRRMMTEAIGPRSETWRRRFGGAPPERKAEAVPLSEIEVVSFLQFLPAERLASFFMTGGLAAVHAEGRDRDAVWGALQRNEVYGTSGERILLWFDLLNGPAGPTPMGATTEVSGAPRFRVRAVGAFEQNPGCPEHSAAALGPERLEYLCRGECYNPSDERRPIARIEVVRIRRQAHADEPVGELIQDPWRSYLCSPDPAGCVVEFEDPGFPAAGREVVYYVRAIQGPTLAVNAAALRCDYDEDGTCVEVHPCYGDYRTDFDDDCLAPNEERAWSSPIYVRPSTKGTPVALGR